MRDVHVPPHLMGALRDHMVNHAELPADSLLFPNGRGQHLQPSTLARSYYAARAAAGRSDLAFHRLRHTGSVLAASAGATLPELQQHLGHSSVGAALRYLHAAEGADARIAARLSEIANGTP